MTDPTGAASTTEMCWRDSQGQPWTVRADTTSLVLSDGAQIHVIPHENLDHAVDYNEVAGGVVLRIDLDSRQVGFLVPSAEANDVLTALNWTNTKANLQAERLRHLDSRPHTWPTVTRLSIVTLFCAAASTCPWQPWIGVGLGCLAVVGIAGSWWQARSHARLQHVRALALAAGACVLIGAAANTLCLVAEPVEGTAAAGVPANLGPDVRSIIIAIIMVLLSLTIHEMAHALTAWWCGDLGPVHAGRVTLNPLAHIDPLGTILVPAVLAYWGGMVFGWAKPVMVTLHGVPNPRRANILISAAGPASNLLMAMVFFGLFVILACVLPRAVPQADIHNLTAQGGPIVMDGFKGAGYVALLAASLKWGVIINLILCGFNLIPLPPLDGSHIARALFPSTVGRFYHAIGPFALLLFLGMIATGVFGALLQPIYRFTGSAFDTVGHITGL